MCGRDRYAVLPFPSQGLGVLSVLDDQCKFPKATDEAFSHKLRETLSGQSHFGVTPRAPGDFIVLHYAGPVQYSSSGFLDKNKDTLNAGEAGGAGVPIMCMEVTLKGHYGGCVG